MRVRADVSGKNCLNTFGYYKLTRLNTGSPLKLRMDIFLYLKSVGISIKKYKILTPTEAGIDFGIQGFPLRSNAYFHIKTFFLNDTRHLPCDPCKHPDHPGHYSLDHPGHP